MNNTPTSQVVREFLDLGFQVATIDPGTLPSPQTRNFTTEFGSAASYDGRSLNVAILPPKNVFSVKATLPWYENSWEACRAYTALASFDPDALEIRANRERFRFFRLASDFVKLVRIGAVTCGSLDGAHIVTDPILAGGFVWDGARLVTVERSGTLADAPDALLATLVTAGIVEDSRALQGWSS